MATFATYPTNGTNDTFTIPFPYIERAHVIVKLNDVVQPSSNYTFPTISSVKFNSVPAAGGTVEVRRSTPAFPITEYQTGGVLTKGDLETDSKQALFLIEEFADDKLNEAAVLALIDEAGADGLGAGFLRQDLLSTAPGKGSELISFLQSGVGAVTRTLLSKGRDFYNVRDFGAVGDGITDDTNAFKAALSAVSLAQTVRGASIYVPRGHYKLTDTLILSSYVADNANNLAIIGEGYLSTWLDFSTMAGGKDGILVSGDQQVMLRGFFLKGGAGVRDGIHMGRNLADGGANNNAVSVFDISDVRVQGCSRDGVHHYNSYMGTMSRVYALANGRDGFHGTGYHTSLLHQNCYALDNVAAGFNYNGIVYSAFLGCGSDLNQFGFVLSNARAVSYKNCGAEGNAQDGWLVFADQNTVDTTNPHMVQECYDVRGVSLDNCSGYGNNTLNAGYAGLVRLLGNSTHTGAGTFNDGSPHRVEVTVRESDANSIPAGTKAIVTQATAGGVAECQEEGRNYFPGGRTIGAGTVHNNRSVAGKVCLLQTVAQTVTNATDTLVTFNTTPVKNDLGATVAATSITIPAGVNKVRVTANMAWAANATGYRKMQVLKNATGTVGLPTEDQTANPSTFTIHNTSGGVIDVTAGDTISMRIHQTSGGNLDTLGATPAAWISVEALG